MSGTSQGNKAAKSLAKLSLGDDAPKRKKKQAPVADSWDDEDVSSSSEHEESADHEEAGKDMPSAPPPTPSSPSHPSSRPWSPVTTLSGPAPPRSPDQGQARRPEKTDAVARRMIAGALGLKAPKATEEQKVYQKAIREQEQRRRDEERASERRKKEEEERVKAAIWND